MDGLDHSGNHTPLGLEGNHTPSHQPLNQNVVAPSSEELTRALLAYVSSQQVPAGKAKFPLPEAYTEASRPEDFVSAVRLFLKHSPAYSTEGSKCFLFISLFKARHAVEWAAGLRESESYLLEDFEELVKAFIDINPDASVRLADSGRLLHSIRMKPGQKFGEFWTDFQRIARASREDDSTVFFCLANSLNRRLSSAYLSHRPQPKSLVELTKLLVALDSGISYQHPSEPETSTNSFPQPMDLGQFSIFLDKIQAATSAMDKFNLAVMQNGAGGNRKGRRLSPEERQRRFDNNLCLVCADPNHLKDKCPLSRHRSQGNE